MSVQLTKYSMLSTLSLLESKLPYINNSFYNVSEDFQSNNLVSLHKEATRIFNFLGLCNYTVLISYIKMDKNAGDIELNNNSEKVVYININEEYRNSNPTVLCILAHEICHKLLFVNGLHISNMNLENEVRTDLATIITGLGKLTLNGCKALKVTDKKMYQNKIGYLSEKQFAEAYYYVYSSRGLSTEKMLEGVDWVMRDHINTFIKNDSYKGITPYTTSLLIKNIQDEEASLLYFIKYLTSVCELINYEVKQSINNKYNFINTKGLNIYNNKPLSLLFTHTCIKEQFNDDSKFRYLTCKIKQFLHDVYGKIGTINSHNNTIICPLCGYNTNSSTEKDSVYKCPKCQYLFYNKTSLFTYNNEIENANEKEIQLLKEKISKLETELLISNQKINKYEKGSLKYRIKALLNGKLPL